MRHFDLIIAGGGAAGVMAAGVAAAAGRSVLLCESMEKPQRKVRITGKGRCNLSNMRSEADFLARVRAGAEFFAPAFRAFDNRALVAFFEGIGVPMVVERGERVFPESGRAWDIAEAHIRWAEKAGVRIECHTRVAGVDVTNGRIRGVLTERRDGVREEATCGSFLIATGGASYPATGSTGDGYELAHKLGHTIEPVRPSLTPLETAADVRSVQGLSLRNVSVRLLIDGEQVAEEFGELEFTATGVGGPVVLRVSRLAVDALIDGRKAELLINLKPALSVETLAARIARERDALPEKATVRDLGVKLLPSSFVPLFLRSAGIESRTALKQIGPREEEAMIGHLKNFRMPLTDYRPFEEAIVTAGGVSTAEVDPQTMQSRLVKGLYFAGEVLDIDADTGGYNLQIAYSTGHLAGQLKK